MMSLQENYITITIESFGAIGRELPHSFHLQCPVNILVRDVLAGVVELYPRSAELLDRCACAIGEALISRETTLMQDCSLVLLSPVAGG